MKLLSIILVLMISMPGCALRKKKDLAERVFELFDEYKGKVVSNYEIALAARNRPKLPENFKMAVYFKGPEEKVKTRQIWRWTEEDKTKIISSFDSRKNKLAKVFELINTSDSNQDINSLRLMAAQQGADALLVVQGASEVDTDLNPWAVTYVAIIPTFFVKGNDVHGAFVTQAVLWNVKTANVHMGAESEGEWTQRRPLIFRQVPRVVEKSKADSVLNLSKKLKKDFNQLI